MVETISRGVFVREERQQSRAVQQGLGHLNVDLSPPRRSMEKGDCLSRKANPVLSNKLDTQLFFTAFLKLFPSCSI